MTKSQELDSKLLYRINAVHCGQQVANMSTTSIRTLTNDFEECYVRRLIAKCESSQDQLQVLEAIEHAFDEIFIDDVWNGEPQYNRDPPQYFDAFRLDLEIGLPIMVEDSLPVQDSEHTPDNWISASNAVSNSLTQYGELLGSILSQFKSVSDQGLSQMDAMRNGIIRDLTDRLAKSESQNQKLREEIQRLKASKPAVKPFEDDPFRRTVTYENVVNHIARRDIHHRREELINMFEALLPKDMHEKFRDDINDKVEAMEAKRRAKRRSQQPAVRQNSSQVIVKVQGAQSVQAFDIHDNNNVDPFNLL